MLTDWIHKLPASWFFALGLLLGIQLALLLSTWPFPDVLILLSIASIKAAINCRWGVTGFLFGYCWLLVFLAWRMELAPSHQDTQGPVQLEVQVLEARASSQGLDSLLVQVRQCTRLTGERCGLRPSPTSRVRLNWYAQEPLPQPGEVWQLEARLRPLDSLKNFQAFHFTGLQISQGLVARGYVGRSAEGVQLRSAQGLYQLRNRWLEHLDSRDLHPDGQRFFKALALGERNALEPEDWTLLERTGTIHLWVISGLHLGMLAGLVLWLAKRLAWPWIPALLLSLLVAWSYAHLSGWGVAAQRAAIMLGFTALLLSGWRKLSPWTIFSLALAGVLVMNPLLVLGRGFWLSFGAVACLLWALRGLPQAGAWINLLRVQWVITLGLTPLLIWQGAYFSVWAPLVNLVAVPLVGLLLLPLSFISLVLLAITGSSGLAVLTSHLLGYAALGLEQVAAWPNLTLQHPAWLVLGFLGLMPPGFPGRNLAPLGLVLAFLPGPEPAAPSDDLHWQVRVLDVGQGTAVLVESQGQQLLYDTGRGFPSGWAPVISALEPWVSPQGLHQVVISHDDIDHSGGLAALLDTWPVHKLWMSRPLQAKSPGPRQGRLCYAGQTGSLGSLDLLVLWPPRPIDRRVEDGDSCVLLIRGKTHSLLLTGDAGTTEEGFFSQALPKLLQNRPLTLLQTGHHGSHTSTGSPLLAATQPLWALHTSGWRNSYGHPHPSVVKRLRDFQVRQLDTGHQGAVHIQLEPGRQPDIKTWRQDQQPLWYWLRHKPN